MLGLINLNGKEMYTYYYNYNYIYSASHLISRLTSIQGIYIATVIAAISTTFQDISAKSKYKPVNQGFKKYLLEMHREIGWGQIFMNNFF